MNRLESELLDLEELLMRNDGMADDGTYSTIVGIANDVSKLEEENENLRELVCYARNELKKAEDELGRDLMNSATVLLGIRMRELGIEVTE